MRYVITIVITFVATMLVAVFMPLAPRGGGADARSRRRSKRSSWISNYHDKPDPAGVPARVRARHMGAFKDVETSGTQGGFLAGVLAPIRRGPRTWSPGCCRRRTTRSGSSCAIAYSGLSDWRSLLANSPTACRRAR
jgi:hypothetical protein